MKVTKEIKDKIDHIIKTFAKGNTTIVSVGLGQKVSAGKVTGDDAIVIGVIEKKPIEELSSEEIMPSEITVGNKVIKIDIIQQSPVQLFATCSDCGGWNGPNSGQFTNRQYTRPLRGGVVIASSNNYPSIGTLGTFVQDVASGAILALTNNHVTIEDPTYTSNRNLAAVTVDNDYDPINKIYQGSETAGNFTQPVNEVGISLRYAPIHLATTGFVNQVDAAIHSVDFQDIETESIPSSQQYASWQPIGLESVITNQNPPFATTAELDDIYNTNPDIWTSGRTSGARGKGVCGLLRVYQAPVATTVGTALGNVSYNDLIAVIRPDDTTPESQQPGCLNPGLQGDSGSAVYAEFNGVKKLIGLLFAGTCTMAMMPAEYNGNPCCSGTIGVNSCSTVFYLCRIDKIAEQLGIQWWDAAAVNQYTVKKDTIEYVTEVGGSDQRTKFCNGRLHYQAGLTNTLNNPCIPTP